MSKKTVPEVDIIVDEQAGVIREVKPQKTRSKSGHERSVNTVIYVVLVVMSIIWIAPFIFLVFQSFRSYDAAVEGVAGQVGGGMVNYLLPKHWSLDNYRWLFAGSDLFPWLGRTLAMACLCAAVETALLVFLRGRKRKLNAGLKLLAGAVGSVMMMALLVLMDHVPVDTVPSAVRAALVLAAAVLVCWALARFALKTDRIEMLKLQAEDEETLWERIKKVAAIFAEFGFVYLLMRACLVSMEMGKSGYIRWYTNTLVIALFCAALQTIMILSVSYTLSRLRFKGRKLIMNIVLVLGLFPGFLTMIVLYFLLKMLGLTQEGAVPGLILIYVASSGMGYYVSKGFFDTIPKSLDESARIDGATRLQVFYKIIMPLAKPIVIYTILMAFMAPWADYVFASYVAFGKSSSYNVAVGLYQWINNNDYQGYFTRFCAGGVLVAVPITILFLCLQKYYVEGVTGGAVKG